MSKTSSNSQELGCLHNIITTPDNGASQGSSNRPRGGSYLCHLDYVTRATTRVLTYSLLCSSPNNRLTSICRAYCKIVMARVGMERCTLQLHSLIKTLRANNAGMKSKRRHCNALTCTNQLSKAGVGGCGRQDSCCNPSSSTARHLRPKTYRDVNKRCMWIKCIVLTMASPSSTESTFRKVPNGQNFSAGSRYLLACHTP